ELARKMETLRITLLNQRALLRAEPALGLVVPHPGCLASRVRFKPNQPIKVVSSCETIWIPLLAMLSNTDDKIVRPADVEAVALVGDDVRVRSQSALARRHPRCFAAFSIDSRGFCC